MIGMAPIYVVPIHRIDRDPLAHSPHAEREGYFGLLTLLTRSVRGTMSVGIAGIVRHWIDPTLPDGHTEVSVNCTPTN